MEANFEGVFLKNRRLDNNILRCKEFHNSKHVDRDDPLGTLLGTLQKHHAKSASLTGLIFARWIDRPSALQLMASRCRGRTNFRGRR
jgi:hypothetical protein